MDIEQLIVDEVKEETPSTRYYVKALREAFEKYSSMGSYDLRNHQRRIAQEMYYFGYSMRTAASALVIKKILTERSTQ